MTSRRHFLLTAVPAASLMLAAHTDLYFPAHQENMFLLSRMNALTCGPVPCASIPTASMQESGPRPPVISLSVSGTLSTCV